MFRCLMMSVLVGALSCSAAGQAQPDVETRVVGYEHDGVRLEGYLARPRGATGELPGVLVVHEWWGLNDYAKRRAREVAALGYVALAVDMYGAGQVTQDAEQAGRWSGALYGNRELLRDRAEEWLEVLEDLEGVDDDRLAAIGYCFGGTVAIELAYEDDDLDAVVSFHGSPKPALEDDDDIDARFLVLHGDADPMVSDADLKLFTDSLDRRDVRYKVVRYDGAKHGFTNPDADDAGIEGVAYDEAADRQSWEAMKTFLRQVFAEDDD